MKNRIAPATPASATLIRMEEEAKTLWQRKALLKNFWSVIEDIREEGLYVGRSSNPDLSIFASRRDETIKRRLMEEVCSRMQEFPVPFATYEGEEELTQEAFSLLESLVCEARETLPVFVEITGCAGYQGGHSIWAYGPVTVGGKKPHSKCACGNYED